VGAEGGESEGGTAQFAAAAVGLTGHEREPVVDALKLVLHVKPTALQVDVLPAQTQGLTLAKTEGQGNGIEGLMAIASHDSK